MKLFTSANIHKPTKETKISMRNFSYQGLNNLLRPSRSIKTAPTWRRETTNGKEGKTLFLVLISITQFNKITLNALWNVQSLFNINITYISLRKCAELVNYIV